MQTRASGGATVIATAAVMLSSQTTSAALGRMALRRTLVLRPPSRLACPIRPLSFFPRPLRRIQSGLLATKLCRETSSKASASRKSQASTQSDNEIRIRTSTGSTSEVTKASNPLSNPTLHEDIYTLPNILTFSRLLAAPFIGYFVLHDSHAWAAGMLVYAGVTDLLDGWIARRWNRKTVVGTVIDPMADKVLMTVLTVCLAVKGALPVWVASIILGRDVGLGIAAIYYRWISLPPPKTFARYWDFSLPSAEVRPTMISKYNTFLQLALVGVTTAAPLVPLDLSQALITMQYVVAATTVWSGASYVYTKDAVKILSAPNQQKPKQ